MALNKHAVDQIMRTLQRQGWVPRFKSASKEEIRGAVKKLGTYGGKQIVEGFDFLIDNPHAQRVVRQLNDKFSVTAAATAMENVRKLLMQAVDEGWSSEVAGRELRKYYDEDLSYRADAIARTEINRAANKGYIEGGRQTGLVKRKQWLANADGCPYCLEMDGKQVGIDEPFLEKGAQVIVEDEESEETQMMTADYGDVEAADLHPNCRCTIQLVIEMP